ncbi:hypothetical protein [Inquilinus limosus]|uniref:hypothetical protein n=1 Tax=Inquilinus limosus TaxID=171674 RepID=UPI0004164DF7|nr:hypothetical protein [Inquilinus limosus]
MSETWPLGLTYQPSRDDFDFDPHEPNLRTDMEAGPPRERARFSRSPATFRQTWLWDLDEFELFKGWYRHTLGNGLKWFTMPLFTGAKYEPTEVKFIGPYRPKLRGSMTWAVSATLLVRQLPTINADSVWFLGTYGPADAARLMASLDQLVNVTLPTALPTE